MSNQNDDRIRENNFIPAVLGFIDFGILLSIAMPLMSFGTELWDFIFVATGVYFEVKFIRFVSKAHEQPMTRVNPRDRTSIPREGIYARIRHPVAAGAMYMNIAFVFFFRSLYLIPVVTVFGAMWYVYAKHDEYVMLQRFGDEYRQYMRGTSMFRGAGFDQQRLASSGYDMY